MNWVFLRGLTRDQRHWGSFPEALTEALGGRALCLDAPGFGTERDRPSPSTVAGITDDLRERFLEQAGDDEWSLFGISLGGMVTLDWCARFPDDFTSAVAVNTSTRDAAPLHVRFSPAGMKVMVSKLSSEDAGERAALSVASNQAKEDLTALAEDWVRWQHESPPHRGSGLAQVRAAAAFRTPTSVTTPLLIVSSKGDRLVSHRCSVAIADRLRAPLVLHDTAGHDLTLDDPGWVTEQVRDWVRGLSHA